LNTPAAEIVHALERVHADPPDTQAGNTALFRAYFDENALHTKYFLMVIEHDVTVATGLFPCNTLPSPGIRAYWLAGDYVRHVNGLTAPPKIHRVSGAIDLQNAAFRHTTVAAPTLADIVTACAGPGLFLPPLPANQANPPAEVNVPKALPVHPKVAAYFMEGVPIREAVARVNEIIQLVPPDMRGHTDLLSDWIRAALTESADPNRSWLHI